jgi:glycosyltransferase involved in cell wall biosynthesis
MRILWFISSPSPASGLVKTDSVMTGWVFSLEKFISSDKNIELGVAFPFGYESPKNFKVGDTSYFTFPVGREKGKIAGLYERWTHKIEPENDIDSYLRVIDIFKPDLVHIFGSESSYGRIISRISIPVILQIQGNLTVCSLKYFAGFTPWESVKYSNIKSFLLGYNTWHQFYKFRKRALREEEFMRKAKYIIGRTDWDKYITRIMAPDSAYFHCEEILREPFYSLRWKGITNGRFRLFSTLSGSTYKGFETILSAAALLKKNTNLDFEWHIAGIDESHEIIKITERSGKLKFADNNFIFRGLMGADALAADLVSSDCFVHPSHIENSPNSVCEAMLTGTPVIATAAGGTTSILLNGSEGLLVQVGDPYALAGAILELAGSPEKRLLFSENARQRALQRHNPEKVLETMSAIYMNVIKTDKK